MSKLFSNTSSISRTVSPGTQPLKLNLPLSRKHTHTHTVFRRLTVLAMSANIHDQTALLQSVLHAGLPVCVAHFCHLVPVHRQHLVSGLKLAHLGLAACPRQRNTSLAAKNVLLSTAAVTWMTTTSSWTHESYYYYYSIIIFHFGCFNNFTET